MSESSLAFRRVVSDDTSGARSRAMNAALQRANPERNRKLDEQAVQQELASWDGSTDLSEDAKQAMTLVAQSPANVGGDQVADLQPAAPSDQAQA